MGFVSRNENYYANKIFKYFKCLLSSPIAILVKVIGWFSKTSSSSLFLPCCFLLLPQSNCRVTRKDTRISWVILIVIFNCLSFLLRLCVPPVSPSAFNVRDGFVPLCLLRMWRSVPSFHPPVYNHLVITFSSSLSYSISKLIYLSTYIVIMYLSCIK